MSHERTSSWTVLWLPLVWSANSIPQPRLPQAPHLWKVYNPCPCHGHDPPPVSAVCTVRKEQVSYAKALADCQAFFPDCEARPRRARRRGARRRVGECGPVWMVHTQPLVSPTAAYVRPDAIQRCPEYAAVWPWATSAVLEAGTTRGGLRHCGGCYRALDAV